jgi:Signal peptidase (SPase) II
MATVGRVRSKVIATREGRLERLAVAATAALALALIDLDVKRVLTTPWWAYHHRSVGWFVLCVVVLLVAGVLTRIPSRAVAIGAGILGGGVLGNLVSARLNGGSVPDPLLVGTRVRGIAFNLADIFTLTGIVILISALIVVTIQNRDRLPPPTRPERWLLRKLRL